MNGTPTSVQVSGRGIAWRYLVPTILLGWWTLSAAGTARPYLFIDGVNLAFHEAGHLFFRPFGSTLHILGGTLLQLLVPGLLCGYFLVKQQTPFPAALCAWWLGESLTNVAVYMADARVMRLDLVGGGEHDWNTLFYSFGLLGEDSVARISGLTQFLGVVVMLAGLAWVIYFALPQGPRQVIAGRLTGRFPVLQILFEE